MRRQLGARLDDSVGGVNLCAQQRLAAASELEASIHCGGSQRDSYARLIRRHRASPGQAVVGVRTKEYSGRDIAAISPCATA